MMGATRERDLDHVRGLLDDALAVIDHSTAANKRDDGLYHAYNIAEFNDNSVSVSHLYPMLEGQVAALSAGSIDAEEAAGVVEALFDSAVYRPGQNSFMLYPDRDLPGFLQRNSLPEDKVQAIPLLLTLLERNDRRVIVRDAEGCLRFNADFTNEGDLNAALDEIASEYDAVASDRNAVLDLYESVFHHSEFTGRSGTMFGFEGLGSIYWHMVSKLLLALAENYFGALDDGASPATLKRLGELYYRVRAGIGFNKTPAEYGAFPTDPYSHTPKHSGARQPGMTGQVKEEVLTRFAELGICVQDGYVSIRPALLRTREFAREKRPFCYLDVNNSWQDIAVPGSSIAFTWCQVPFVYILNAAGEESLTIEFNDGTSASFPDLALPADISESLFMRDGKVRKVSVSISAERLFGD
jgi:hypothetical protein